jgi:hypothetical protein
VWVDDIDVARILSNGASGDFVSDVMDVLLCGVLLSRLPYAERYGPPVEEVVFVSPELERLNSSRGIADA